MAKIVNDKRLTVNEAALLYCILGSPDPKNSEKRIYPTIKESINYMMGESLMEEETKEVEAKQLTFF